MSVFSLSGNSENPSAYTCTIAASSTRSSKYLRSEGGDGFVATAGVAADCVDEDELPPAALPRMDMTMRAFLIICSNLLVRDALPHAWTTSARCGCAVRARPRPQVRRGQ